nr:MAG TPA_asm: hypothetical protein [Caudoviricetes sp.]
MTVQYWLTPPLLNLLFVRLRAHHHIAEREARKLHKFVHAPTV